MKEVLIVFTNAVPGEEAAFNEWYDNVHGRDVVTKIAGFEAIQRFELAEVEGGQEAPYRYLAIYEIAEGQLETAQRALAASSAERKAALGEGRQPLIPIGDAISDDRCKWYFTAIGERRTTDDYEQVPAEQSS